MLNEQVSKVEQQSQVLPLRPFDEWLMVNDGWGDLTIADVIEAALGTADEEFYNDAVWFAECRWSVKDPERAAAYKAALNVQGDLPTKQAALRAWWADVTATKTKPARERAKPANDTTPDALLIVERCNQMLAVLEAGGDVAEPYWWAALRVAAHCSPDITYELSSGYPKFSEAELQQRLDRIERESLKPATCSGFASANPAGCAGCKWHGKIKSPVSLGFEHLPKGGVQ